MTVPHSGAGWRLAPALIAMEAEANRIAPRRRRSSDGSIGDRSHRNRFSHHNPQGGWVDALDISHDPADGMDIHAQARNMVARRDPRLEEVISNRRIWSRSRSAQGWRRYSGENPHTLHGHFVVRDAYRHDRSPWFSGQVWFPTKPIPHDPITLTPSEDDEMDEYLEGKPSGKIVHVYGERFRHLSPPRWGRRQFLGARVTGVLPDDDLEALLADLIPDPT